MTALSEHSANHIRECYEFYKQHAPFEVGMHLIADDEFCNENAKGRMAEIYWSDYWWDWICCIEVSTEFCVVIEEFSASLCKRHVGFWPEVV